MMALQQITVEFNRKKLTKLTSGEIKKKLHGIRTQYMAELQRIRNSESSGAGSSDIYKPKLWCFDLLAFLQQGTAVVARGESNLTSSQSQSENASQLSRETQAHQEDPESEVLFEGDIENIEDIEINLLSPSSVKSIQSTSRTASRCEDNSQIKQTKKRTAQEKLEVTQLIDQAVVTLRALNEEPKEDASGTAADLFGKLVAKEIVNITDEEILELKKTILMNIFAAKKRQRQKNKE